MQHELIGKYCKLVFKDGKQEKVIKGIVKDIDDFTVNIVGERDNKLDFNSTIVLFKRLLYHPTERQVEIARSKRKKIEKNKRNENFKYS